LLQSGLIDIKDLERKYKDELHANEIVLLAYYIAAINIENAYHDATPDPDDGVGKPNYTSFDGIVLTDTFQLSETREGEIQYEEMLKKNSDRVEKQRKAPLRIIIGNPPYSVGQKSADDNAQNQTYPKLDKRIADTYQAIASGTGKRALYDAYIKAFRWSTDRLDKTGGVICLISNSSWLDGIATAGFRLYLEKEFSSIYVFNLRGNANSKGEFRRKEAGNIFGGGSKTPVAITLLVKNPEVKTEKAIIHYHDIGDYLDRDKKLKILKEFKTFANPKLSLTTLQPNEHGDWLNERNNLFEVFIPLGEKDKNLSKELTFFKPIFSYGIITARDSWVWNYSNELLSNNVQGTIDFYNAEREKFSEAKRTNPSILAKNFISINPTRISWDSRRLIGGVEGNKEIKYDKTNIRTGFYRPFTKQLNYFSLDLSHSLNLQKSYFPSIDSFNLVICTSVPGTTSGFTTMICNGFMEYSFGQCFPLHYYEENKLQQKGLFDGDESQQYVRRDALSDFILERARQQYGKTVTKEDIFYYVYGLLHNHEYRETFANDLKKMLPRLPLVENIKDFWVFSKAGRQLAELHLNYETVAPSPDVTVTGDDGKTYTVNKIRFPKKDQKDTIHYNSKITVNNIPAKAYEYIVNGKSAIEWIMERYQVSTHKESGIKNDPNDWADEVGNPRYILDLLLSIINISVQTVDIVNSLPKVDFGIEPTDKNVEKMYPIRVEDEQINIAAEPGYDE
jgi:predicted helicase